jgi:hypothetical protein
MTEVSYYNEAARRLLEREGYHPMRHFLRLIVEMEDDPCATWKEFFYDGKLKLNLVVDSSNLVGSTHLQQRTGAYVARLNVIYEKELRISTQQRTHETPGEELAVA